MTSVVFYFETHQPHRLGRYSVFEDHPFYFDDKLNGKICEKVADKCYRPATRGIIDLVKRHEGNVRVSYSLTGTLLEQFEQFCPDVIELFQELNETGCCEFLAETYYHSLSFLYDRKEFVEQVDLHTAKMQELFGQTPTVFRNTELIYANELAHAISELTDGSGDRRFGGILCEGVDRILGYRSPNYPYLPKSGTGEPLPGRNGKPLTLLLKNYRLSDDIAFRFSNKSWAEWPLTAEKFAKWVNEINGDGFLCNLFMDYETFGEHQWADTGIFEFLAAMPEKVFDVNPGHNHFNTPSEAIERFEPVGEYDAPQWTSWADSERDLSAWRENAMQHNALDEFYKLGAAIKARHVESLMGTDDAEREHCEFLLKDWRKLSTSDHFYYMCTKYWADGDVHTYFSPYDSPYDAYINFMNVLDNLRGRSGSKAERVGSRKPVSA